MGSARKEGKSAQPTPASIPTLTTHERYSDPRANLHIVSSDGTLFKVHMYNFATHWRVLSFCRRIRLVPSGRWELRKKERIGG